MTDGPAQRTGVKRDKTEEKRREEERREERERDTPEVAELGLPLLSHQGRPGQSPILLLEGYRLVRELDCSS